MSLGKLFLIVIFYSVPLSLWTGSLMERILGQDLPWILDFLITAGANIFAAPMNIILEIIY